MKFEKSRLAPIELELGGVKYPVRVTFSGMAEFEEKFSMPFSEVFNKFMTQDLNAKELQFILWVLLKGGGVEVTLEDLDGVDFSIDTLDVLSEALLKANKITTSLAGQQNTDGEDGEDDG